MSKICLSLFSTKTPYKIRIYSSKNLQIFEKTIYDGFSHLSFFADSPYLMIGSRHKNQKIIQYVETNLCCTKLNLSFNFKEPTNTQKIELNDANYHMPINRAILSFSN